MATAYRHRPTTRFRPWEGPAGGFPLIPLPQVPRCPATAAVYRHRPTTRFGPWEGPAGGFPPCIPLPQVPRCPTIATAYRQRPTTHFRPWEGPAGGFPLHPPPAGPKVLGDGNGLSAAAYDALEAVGRTCGRVPPASPSRRSQGTRQWQRFIGSGLQRALGRGKDLREGSPPVMATTSRHRPTTRLRPWEGPAGGFPLCITLPPGTLCPAMTTASRQRPTTRLRPWEGPAGGFPLVTLPQVPRCPVMATAHRQRPTMRFRPWEGLAGGFPLHHPPAGHKVPGDGSGFPAATHNAL